MIHICDQRFIFQIVNILDLLYFRLPFMEAKMYLTREITLLKLIDLMPVISSSCEVQYKKWKEKEELEPALSDVKQLPIIYDSSDGNYFIEIDGKKFYSFNPEDLDLSGGDWFFLAFAEKSHEEASIDKFLNLPIRYEDEKVKIF